MNKIVGLLLALCSMANGTRAQPDRGVVIGGMSESFETHTLDSSGGVSDPARRE